MKGVDPNRCPNCGHTNTLRELATRATWQPIRTVWNDAGELYIESWREFEYADDPHVTGFDCVDCMTEWPTLEALHAAMEAAPFARDVAANLVYNTLVERGHEAEVVMVCITDSGADLWSEFFGPAVDAAANAIGLTPQPEGTS